MSAQVINTIGLSLSIVGAAITFFYAFPQPTHEEGVGLGAEPNIRLADGRIVAQHDKEVRKTKARYLLMSRIGMSLIAAGFAFQLWAAWSR